MSKWHIYTYIKYKVDEQKQIFKAKLSRQGTNLTDQIKSEL